MVFLSLFPTEELKCNQHSISAENENYKNKAFQNAGAVTCVLSHMVPLETKEDQWDSVLVKPASLHLSHCFMNNYCSCFLLRALPAMMQWVRTQKPGESGVNIITADFVELGDFISTVIKLNYALDEGEDNTT